MLRGTEETAETGVIQGQGLLPKWQSCSEAWVEEMGLPVPHVHVCALTPVRQGRPTPSQILKNQLHFLRFPPATEPGPVIPACSLKRSQVPFGNQFFLLALPPSGFRAAWAQNWALRLGSDLSFTSDMTLNR